MRTLALTICSLLFTGCVAAPPGVDVVKDFDLDRDLGTGYEIARPDHRFERGLSKSPPATASAPMVALLSSIVATRLKPRPGKRSKAAPTRSETRGLVP